MALGRVFNRSALDSIVAQAPGDVDWEEEGGMGCFSQGKETRIEPSGRADARQTAEKRRE